MSFAVCCHVFVECLHLALAAELNDIEIARQCLAVRCTLLRRVNCVLQMRVGGLHDSELAENINWRMFDGSTEFQPHYSPVLLIAARSTNNPNGSESELIKELLNAKADPTQKDSTDVSFSQYQVCSASRQTELC